MVNVVLKWYQSILFRTGLVLILVVSLVGLITVEMAAMFERNKLEKGSTVRLEQLLDTVENTASVACFTGDEVLAKELANGLLKNSEVLSVTVFSGNTTLAHLHRPEDEIKPHTHSLQDAFDLHHPLTHVEDSLERNVFSPFAPDQQVGRILLIPNHAEIRLAISSQTREALSQMLMELLAVAIAVLATVLLQVIRPIQRVSETLHSMDATSGERIEAPYGHERSEIGNLVDDINQLANRLVATLDEERTLRIRREVDERRYHAIFENAESGIFLLEAGGHLNSWNPAFARMLQLPEQLNVTENISLLGLNWKNSAMLAVLLQRCLSENRNVSMDLSYLATDGSEHWLNVLLSPTGEDESLQGVIHDVTAHKRAEESAKRLAHSDLLTGLLNRNGLIRKLNDLVGTHHADSEDRFALFLVDFDDFKRVNESFGLTVGDEVLREAGLRLSGCVKSKDVVARLGSDQFAIAFPDLHGGIDIGHIANRILGLLRQRFAGDDNPIKLHASIGIALYPDNYQNSIPDLLHHAELALTQAKSCGGNRLHYFDPALAEAIELRRALENDLRLAVQGEQFVLFYQPIIDLQENRLVGAEALVRWQHPARGLVPPDAFIPLAEETGLIDEIGLWVIKAAAKQLRNWRTEGDTLYLSINVSGRQIPHGLNPELLQEIASQQHIEARKLALEITEGVLLSEGVATQEWLKAVRNANFPVYLDDFGTGYSSLSYLKRYRVDRLKIDKSFISDINVNASDRALVEAVLAMARSFHIDVVAEGVEDAEHVATLRKMGCRFAQGYYFSRPVAIDEFERIRGEIPALLASTGGAALGSSSV